MINGSVESIRVAGVQNLSAFAASLMLDAAMPGWTRTGHAKILEQEGRREN